MFFIQFIARIIAVLRAAATPVQIANGFCMGMIIGFTPSFLVSFIIFLLLIILDVNLTAAFLSIALFGIAAYVLDPLFHTLGYFLLVDAGFLQDLWIMLYNTPLIPFTEFNNTVVMGSFFFSILLFVPVFFLVKKGIINYRLQYAQKVNRWKIIRFIQSTTLFDWYKKLKRLGDQLLW